jgi:hypothetical protein
MPGILLAFFFYEHGGAKKTQTLDIAVSRVYTAGVVCIALMLWSIYGSYGAYIDGGVDSGHCGWGWGMNFMYMAFINLFFTMGVTFVMFAGLFGYGGVITRLLAWDVFAPLGRLVYATYLIHVMLMYAVYSGGNRKADWWVVYT